MQITHSKIKLPFSTRNEKKEKWKMRIVVPIVFELHEIVAITYSMEREWNSFRVKSHSMNLFVPNTGCRGIRFAE